MVAEVWLSFLNSASTTLWCVHQNKVSSMQASEFNPPHWLCAKSCWVTAFSLHGISSSRSVHPPVGSSRGFGPGLVESCCRGERKQVCSSAQTTSNICCLFHSHTFSLDAVPATCLFLAGAAAASASAGRRCAQQPRLP